MRYSLIILLTGISCRDSQPMVESAGCSTAVPSSPCVLHWLVLILQGAGATEPSGAAVVSADRLSVPGVIENG